jgi:hypothetical protein
MFNSVQYFLYAILRFLGQGEWRGLKYCIRLASNRLKEIAYLSGYFYPLKLCSVGLLVQDGISEFLELIAVVGAILCCFSIRFIVMIQNA